MRDILDRLTLITESTGLAGRKPGDVFKDSEGNKIIFNKLSFYPEDGGKYQPEELDGVLEEVTDQLGEVQWMNARTSKIGGFGIAAFDTEQGPIYFGRYLEQVKPNFTSNFIPNQVGPYKLASKSAEKMQASMTPQDLLKNLDNLTADDILNQLAENLGEDNPLYAVAYRLAHGEPLPMKFPAPQGVNFSAFRDYFCEILQPIALQRGQYTGNAGEAAEIFLGGSFDDTLISFDFSKTAGLSDSTLTNEEGKLIKISSKGGKGAEASARNLVNSLDDMSKIPQGKKLQQKYKDTVETLREIQKNGQIGAPLYLGVKYDIITQKDADKIRGLKDIKPMSMSDIGALGLSKNLKKLATTRTPDDPDNVNMFYHLIAAVAYEVASTINNETDFSKAAADILNNGALVQVYTKAREGSKEWVLDEFKTVYPGKSIKGIYLSAAKNYYSTGIKGNFTFKIDRGEGKPKEDEGAGREKRTGTKAPSEKEFAQKAAKIAKGQEKPKFNQIKARPTGVGREKR